MRSQIRTSRADALVFDLGASWERECRVLRDRVDPTEEAGLVLREIVPIFGWGTIPDQYGRATAD